MTPDELKREWVSGDALRVGEALLKPLAPAARVAIAADVLRVCASVFKPVPEVDQVLAISVDRGRWPEAHGAFQALRRRALAEKDKSLEAVFLVVICTAFPQAQRKDSQPVP
jgi:hypothetical protein